MVGPFFDVSSNLFVCHSPSVLLAAKGAVVRLHTVNRSEVMS